MRIISGIYRGRVIKSPADSSIRPTSDRLRETLFNILQPYFVQNTSFLDLCAGTGAIGIEAFSRGAENVAFVDVSRKSIALIEENLEHLKITHEKAKVFCECAEKFVERKLAGFSIVYFDPPYLSDYSVVLNPLGETNNQILQNEGVLIVEHSKKIILPEVIGSLVRFRVVKQGEAILEFFKQINETYYCLASFVRGLGVNLDLYQTRIE